MRLSIEARRASVTAVISVVSAILGGSLTAVVAVVVQDEEFEERRASESRDERARVYREFLVAAERYRSRSEAVPEECGRQLAERPNQPCRVPAFVSAVQNYQRAINDVYVFGSDDAVEAEGEVSALLPPSLAPLPEDWELGDVDDAKFKRAYQGFLAVMCRELPPEPRSGC